MDPTPCKDDILIFLTQLLNKQINRHRQPRMRNLSILSDNRLFKFADSPTKCKAYLCSYFGIVDPHIALLSPLKVNISGNLVRLI